MSENAQTQQDTATPGTGAGADPGTGPGYDAGYRAGYQAASTPQPPYGHTSYRRLTRSRPGTPEGAPISGVCGGLAQYFGLDPTLVRVLFAVAAVVAFPVAEIAYVVMWAVIPQE